MAFAILMAYVCMRNAITDKAEFSESIIESNKAIEKKDKRALVFQKSISKKQ